MLSINYLFDLAEVVNKSKEILELKTDWDGCGAKKIKSNTWYFAKSFIINTYHEINNHKENKFPIPSIRPCNDGSIDIYWGSDEFSLIVNIKSNNTLFFHFQLSDDRNNMKGNFINTNCQNLGFINLILL